ncbi:hypothetical protein D3C86_2083030 [compost metagenome]
MKNVSVGLSTKLSAFCLLTYTGAFAVPKFTYSAGLNGVATPFTYLLGNVLDVSMLSYEP